MDIKINAQMLKSQTPDDFSGVNVAFKIGGVK